MAPAIRGAYLEMENEKIDELVKKAVVADLGGLDILAGYSYEDLAKCYNGIGPEFLPAGARAKVTDYLSLFEPAALIHDVRYDDSDGSRYGFNFANLEFRENCFKLADAAYPWYSWRRYRAYLAAEALFSAVASEAGWVAYLESFSKKRQTQKEEQ